MKNSTNDLESNDHISDLPQILSRSETSLLSALANLGAADVVECYILTRSATLEHFSSHDIHMSDHTQPGYALEVRKSAIAFFYRPKGSKSPSQTSSTKPDNTKKKHLQLTLEYGPTRVGAFMNYDTVPTVMQAGMDERYVSWSNDAKIYYTFASNVTEIRGWDNAYFMAPMTGAVLSKVLDYILDYTTHHPRYQPFVVRSMNITHMQNDTSSASSFAAHSYKSSYYSNSSKDLIVLQSSNSDDFVRNIIDQLALLYVDFRPILTPNFYAIELYVSGGKWDSQYLTSDSMIQDLQEEDGKYPNPIHVAHAAALFYNKLYSCIRAEQTGDYSAFIKLTRSPTSSPSFVPTYQPTVIPTTQPSAAPISVPTVEPTSPPSLEITSSPTFEPTNTSESFIIDPFVSRSLSTSPSSIAPTVAFPTSSPTQYKSDISFSPTTFTPSSTTLEPTLDEIHGHRIRPPPRDTNLSRRFNGHRTLQKSVFRNNIQQKYGISYHTLSQHLRRVSPSSVSSDPSSSNRDHSRSVTAIISTCLSDPKYGIRRLASWDNNSSELNYTSSLPTNHSSTTHIYLYLDGAHYLRINATDPFLAIVSAPLSIAQVKPIPEDKWDKVDWLIVILIVYGFIYGVISILDHIGLVDMHTFCLRWKKAKVAYAHTRATSETDNTEWSDDPANDGMNEDEEVDDAIPGRYIPSSMGGWRKYSPTHPTRLFFAMKRGIPIKNQISPLLRGDPSIDDDELNNGMLENVEGMAESLPCNNMHGYERLHMAPRSLHDEMSPRGESNHSRKLIIRQPKDPDMVDIPDLTFSSRIAVPASASTSPEGNGIMA